MKWYKHTRTDSFALMTFLRLFIFFNVSVFNPLVPGVHQNLILNKPAGKSCLHICLSMCDLFVDTRH